MQGSMVLSQRDGNPADAAQALKPTRLTKSNNRPKLADVPGFLRSILKIRSSCCNQLCPEQSHEEGREDNQWRYSSA